MMLSDVCLSDVCLSDAYIGPKSRTEKPRKTKIGTEVADVTRDSDTTFKVKRSKVKVTGGGGILWRPPAQLVSFASPSPFYFSKLYIHVFMTVISKIWPVFFRTRCVLETSNFDNCYNFKLFIDSTGLCCFPSIQVCVLKFIIVIIIISFNSGSKANKQKTGNKQVKR